MTTRFDPSRFGMHRADARMLRAALSKALAAVDGDGWLFPRLLKSLEACRDEEGWAAAFREAVAEPWSRAFLALEAGEGAAKTAIRDIGGGCLATVIPYLAHEIWAGFHKQPARFSPERLRSVFWNAFNQRMAYAPVEARLGVTRSWVVDAFRLAALRTEILNARPGLSEQAVFERIATHPGSTKRKPETVAAILTPFLQARGAAVAVLDAEDFAAALADASPPWRSSEAPPFTPVQAADAPIRIMLRENLRIACNADAVELAAAILKSLCLPQARKERPRQIAIFQAWVKKTTPTGENPTPEEMKDIEAVREFLAQCIKEHARMRTRMSQAGDDT